jgi:DNA-directed RNA polymerase specialized sigma24 family protein
MSAPGSVTQYIDGLRAGDSVAHRKLWENFFHRLVELARKKLRALPRGAADEEDVALSAIDSFCRGAEQGRFPKLDDRDDLWQVLFLLTERKAFDLIEHEGRQRRDWRKVEPATAERSPVADLAGREPDPVFAAQVAEECQRLLGVLGDEELRRIAVWKLEGHTNDEIAALIGRAVATVERRLDRIRKEWEAAGVRGLSTPRGVTE